MKQFAKPSISRRNLIKGAAAVAAAGAGGIFPSRLLAQTAREVSVLAVNAQFGPALKKIVDTEGNVSVNYGAWISAVDATSRLTAPSGSRFDFSIANYDVAGPVITSRPAGKELVRAMPAKDVPNVANVNEVSKRALVGKDGSYSMIPVTMGFDSVLYNREKIDANEPLINSWEFLFSDKYAGRIAWWDAALNSIMSAALFLGHKKPDEMDRAELEEVTKFLISKKKNVRTIFSSFAQATNMLATGEVVAAYGIATMRVDLEKKGVPIETAWVKEGVLSLTSSAFIPTSTANPEPAMAVINAMLGKEYAKAVTRECGYLSCSTFAADDFTPAERKRMGLGILDGAVAHYPQKLPKDMSRWIEAWARVKSA